jgi:ribosomal-protein-serine acetyltransferase
MAEWGRTSAVVAPLTTSDLLRVDLPGDRTIARAYRPEQALEVYAAIEETRASLARWIPDLARRQTLPDVRDGLQQLWQTRPLGQRLLFGIWTRADARCVGEVGLHDIDWTSATASVGYWLRPSARGHGIVDEGLELLVAYGRNLGLRCLNAHIAEENHASRRVAERNGFVWVGHRAADPVWDGLTTQVLIYSLALAEARGA